MTDNEVEVKFVADASGMQQGTNQASRSIEDSVSILQEYYDSITQVNQNLKNTTDNHKKLSLATAGTTREFIVLGHELLTGNFTRIPGSIMVLGERMGSLHSIIEGITPAAIGLAAAIADIAYNLYEWVDSATKLAETENAMRGALELGGQSFSYNSQQAEKAIKSLEKYADIGQETASAIVVAFARSGQSFENQQKLLTLLPGYMSATGQSADKAADSLIKLFDDPAKASEELAAKFPSLISATQLYNLQVKDSQATNDKYISDLLAIIAPGLDNFRQNHLLPLQAAWESLRDSTSGAYSQGKLGTFEAPAAAPVTTDAQKQQDLHRENNEVLLKGLAILREVHGEHQRINDLLQEKSALVAASNKLQLPQDTNLYNSLVAAAKDAQDQIDKIRERANRKQLEDAKKAAAQKIQLEQEETRSSIDIARTELEGKKELLDLQVDLGKINTAQKLQQEKQLTDQEYQLDLKALNDELAIGNLSVLQQKQIKDRIYLLQAEHNRDIEKLNLDLAADQKKNADQQLEDYRRMFDTLGSKFDVVINGILQGTQTWRQAVSHAALDVVTIMTEAAAKVAAVWAGGKIFSALNWTQMASALQPKGGAGAQGGDNAIDRLIAALTGHTIATEANTLSTQASTASSNAQTVQNMTATAVNTTATTANTAALSANSASSGGRGLLSFFTSFLPSFDVGSWSVPNTGLAQIHRGEIIVPPGLSAQVRAGTASIGAAGGGGDTFQININAIDTQTGAMFLKNNASTIAQALKGQIRNFNPATA